MQGLGGTLPGLSRGASMSGNRAVSGGAGAVLLSRLSNRTTINGTFTADTAGLHQFALWSPGRAPVGAAGGGGGALAIRTVRLIKGQSVSYVIGSSLIGTGSSVTFADGTMTCTLDATGVGGVATGGDINVNGNPQVAGVGGAGASYGGLIGGIAVTAPGGGGTASDNADAGGGMLLVTYVGP